MYPSYKREKKVSCPFVLTMSKDVLNEFKRIKTEKNETYFSLLNSIMFDEYPFFSDPKAQEKEIYIIYKTGKRGSTSINLDPEFSQKLRDLSEYLAVTNNKLIENAIIKQLLK